MSMFLIVFGVMLTVVLIMSVGVLMGRKPIKGSCGGMQALGLKEDCDICGGVQSVCDEQQVKQAQMEIQHPNVDSQINDKNNNELAYNAVNKKQ